MNEKNEMDLNEKPQHEPSRYDFFTYDGAPLIPGIVRLRDAPYYLGMNKTYFREQVQPYLTRIPIDKRGIGFNRAELDRWIAYTQATLGQPPLKQPPWENPNEPSSMKTFSIAQSTKLPRKITQKKASPGKPTAEDLKHLIDQVYSSKND